MQTVKFVYSGSATRKLTVMGRDQVIVSGDNKSTQFIFSFPKAYDNYLKLIIWGDIKRQGITYDSISKGVYEEDGEEYPIYPLINNCFKIPSWLTVNYAGKEIQFQIVVYKSTEDDIDLDNNEIEISTQFPVYISKTVIKASQQENIDLIAQLAQSAYCYSSFYIDDNTDRPAIVFKNINQTEIFTLVLDLPYLVDGHIPNKFIEGQVSIYNVNYYSNIQSLEPSNQDLAVIKIGNGVKGDYAGDIYIYDNGQWIPIYSQFDSAELQNKVDKTTTVNGHPLTSDINLTKQDVGLGNVDNTSDLDKPISNAAQQQLDLKADQSDLNSLEGRVSQAEDDIVSLDGRLDTAESDIDTNAQDISELQTVVGDQSSGLVKDVQTLKTEVETTTTGLLDRTTQLETQIQDRYTKSETDTLLDTKVDKVSGKGLSTNDFTDQLKTKLDGIQSGAEVNVQQDWSETETTSDQYIKNKPTLGTAQQLDAGTNSGNVPVLNSEGKLQNTVIPPLAIGELIEWPQGVQSTVQNLVLLSDAEKGDIAVVSDDTVNNNGVYFLNGIYSQQSDWIQIVGPSNVISVNGHTGIVTIGVQDLSGITQAEINAIDSGITQQKVSTYDDYANQIQNRIVKIQSPTAGTLVVSTQAGEVAESSDLTAKLTGIENGAQVNTIESISIDGVEQTPDQNKNVQLNLSAYALDSDVTQIDNRLTAVEGEIGDSSTQGTIIYRMDEAEGKIVSLESGKVDKVTGYNLVADSEIAKLQTVEQNAQENIIEVVKVNDVQLDVTSKTVNIDLSNYVVKETGKGLSTNDFTDQYKTKLDGIEQGAEQNVIEQVQINGTSLPISQKIVQLTLDTVPTEDSNNPVSSGAVYTIKQSVDTNTSAIQTINNSDVMNSGITQAKVQAYDAYQTTKQNVITATPNTVFVQDGTGAIVSSTITTTELGYLSGASSNIQQQLDDKTPYTKAIGEWDSTRTYVLNSTVIYDGKIYIQIYDGPNVNHLPTDETYWSVIEGGGGGGGGGESTAVVRIVGDGVSTEYTINHGLDTYDFFYSIRYNDANNMAYIGAEISALTLNTAKIKFAEAPAVDSIRVIISNGASGGGSSPTGDIGIRYVQQVASNTWTITNTLGRPALIQVMDTTGKFVEGVVTQTKNNDATYTVTVNFNEAIAGTALLI